MEQGNQHRTETFWNVLWRFRLGVELRKCWIRSQAAVWHLAGSHHTQVFGQSLCSQGVLGIAEYGQADPISQFI